MYGYIYLIVNNINGKTYVGQHKSSRYDIEDGYNGSGKLLKMAYKKYGMDNFDKLLVQWCSDREELDEREKFWISYYRSLGKAEYNLQDGATGGWNYVNNAGIRGMQGKHHTSKSRALMSEKRRLVPRWKYGKYERDDEYKMRQRNAHLGKKLGHFYNNGEVETVSNEAPEGFVRGRLPRPRDKNGRFIRRDS